VEIKENLEKFLKLPSGDDAEKVKNAFEWASNIEKDKIPQEFLKIKKFFEANSISIVDKPQSSSENDDIDLEEIPF